MKKIETEGRRRKDTEGGGRMEEGQRERRKEEGKGEEYRGK